MNLKLKKLKIIKTQYKDHTKFVRHALNQTPVLNDSPAVHNKE